jgi:hypothetical protein
LEAPGGQAAEPNNLTPSQRYSKCVPLTLRANR